MATSGPALTRSFDDMDDSFEISFCRDKVQAGHRRYLPLLNALTVSQELILPVFREADRRATHYRAKYQQISLGAVGMGLLAVMLGICEILLPKDGNDVAKLGLTVSEGVAAAFCLIFILLGTIYKPKNNWLLARYRAENLRLLKFKTLADPRLWCENGGASDRSGETPADHVRADVRAAVRAFEGLVYEDVKESAAHGVIPDVSEIHCPESCEEALHEIIHYYCEKRLSTQMDYLTAKSEEDEKGGVVSSLLTNVLFFVSFGLVLFHVALDSAHPKEAPDRFGEALVLGAVLLPALVAGVRTYRASREFERNALRHRATLHSLEGLNVEMGKAKNLARKFKIARACELILEFDSSEFMRLLREVEWYG
ncbi:MAG: hypothetical protein ABSB65_15790 [Candidatus Acidiferrales bacterium]|jgi:hypothetical protein